eukprot:TRINITY_DN1432_c0_g1_i1.p1 TRINITY_DN1432_c0_g1~~TRINITY_DN1432_c0_g1_i1.p1  ORF type:complete len:237 (+),score=41.52 TRINITY_DN1432_c0_g1_i1:67-777(+)
MQAFAVCAALLAGAPAAVAFLAPASARPAATTTCLAPTQTASATHTCRASRTQLRMGRANRFKAARPESKRQARISQLLTAELASIIRLGHHVKGSKALSDELRSKISIVDVNVSPDLRNARIFVSVYGDRLEKREAYGWCVRNTGGIRFALSQRLKDMKGVPELTFQQTDIGAAVDVMHLIGKVNSGSTTESGMVGGFDFDDEGDFEYDDYDVADELDEDEEDDDDGLDESVAPY